MYKKFVAPIIDEPFTIYCDDYSDKKVRKQCVDKIVFTGEWAYYYHNELGYDSYSPLTSIVKVTYTGTITQVDSFEGEIIKIDSRAISLTLSTDVYLPYSKGGSEGHKIFDRIATYLLFDKKLDITKSEATVWTVIVSALVPLIVAAIGTAVYHRRRHS